MLPPGAEHGSDAASNNKVDETVQDWMSFNVLMDLFPFQKILHFIHFVATFKKNQNKTDYYFSSGLQHALPLGSPQIEDVVTRIQDEKAGGVSIRTVKSFLSKIPSVVSG